MSLSARDRQALSSIEDELSGSDPRLAALLDEFSRRTDGAQMPAAERIRAKWPGGFTGMRLLRDHAGWLPAMLVLWLVVVGTMVAVLLTVPKSGAIKGCSVLVAACATQSQLQH